MSEWDVEPVLPSETEDAQSICVPGIGLEDARVQSGSAPTAGRVAPEVQQEQAAVMSTWGDQADAGTSPESVTRNASAPLADPMESAEYAVLKAQIEERTQQSLSPDADAELRQLVRQRVAALKQYGALQRQKQEIQRQRATAGEQEYINQRRAEGMTYEPIEEQEHVASSGPRQWFHPYGWKSAAKQSFVENPKNLGRDLWSGFQRLVLRSAELRQEAFDRGDYIGGQWGAVPYAIGEAGVEGWQSGIERAQGGFEALLEAESAVDAGLASLQVVLGIGEAVLSADSLAGPISTAADMVGRSGIPRGPRPVAGPASAGGAASAALPGVAVDAVAIPSGSLSHATILSVFVDKEPPAAGATDRTTSEHQPEGEQPAEGPQKKRSNTTRTGVERTNRQDWRKLVKSWDEAGYGDALSAENRRRIKDGTTPIVDDAWIEYFPGDVSLRGEKISMHHIGGSKLTVPHPKTRHKDAHTPGGFRKNPGGPGMTGSLGPAGREDSSDERHLA